MRNTKREEDVEKAYVHQEEARGAMCLKFSVQGRAGFPDRVSLLPARHAVAALVERYPEMSVTTANEVVRLVRDASVRFVEVKRGARSGNQPRQPRVQALLRRLGFYVEVLRGTGE